MPAKITRSQSISRTQIRGAQKTSEHPSESINNQRDRARKYIFLTIFIIFKMLTIRAPYSIIPVFHDSGNDESISNNIGQ